MQELAKIYLLKGHQALTNWLAPRPHRERIYILAIGLTIIFLLWYLCLEKPLNDTRVQLNQQIESQQKQLTIFQTEIIHVESSGKKSIEQLINNAKQQAQLNIGKPELASQNDIDVIIKEILTTHDDIRFISLKNATTDSTTGKAVVPGKNNLEITFNSNYLATLAYLTQLEKLPWCLSWDSLEYQVREYPNARVTINLHIVNG